ncbi:MAG: hypothetical protein HY247_02915 [archaeon]|nr:MAG: hypothetical protein HY247_02915 [archaeon]
MRPSQHNEEDFVGELEEIKKDPKRWEEFMAGQAEKALKHWPGRKKR